MIVLICSCKRGNLATFCTYLLKSYRISFYVTNKSCQIRKMAPVDNSSQKCGKFLSLSERHWRKTKQPLLVSALSLLSKGIADSLNCELSTIKCICHIKLSYKNCSCGRGLNLKESMVIMTLKPGFCQALGIATTYVYLS